MSQVLGELAKQVPARGSGSPLAGQVRVFVRLSGARPHPVFDDARREHGADERFRFDNTAGRGRRALLQATSTTPAHNHSRVLLQARSREKTNTTWVDSWVAVRAAGRNDDDGGSTYGVRTAKRRRLLVDGATGLVRAQTRDVVGLLRAVEASGLVFQYFLFQEDDFLPCQSMLLGVQHLALRAGDVMPRWRALRAGYGLNGIVVQASQLPFVARHLKQGEARKPPDHLFFEWANPHVVAYRHNLWFHLGKNSVCAEILTLAKTRFPRRCCSLDTR